MRIFIGYEPRQPLALQVLMRSLYKRASKPLAITPLVLSQLPMKRVGLTEFSFSRYLVPMLCGYQGTALFIDADMIFLGDVCELEAIAKPQAASVCVVNHQGNLRFERPSLMFFDNTRCRRLTPELIETGTPQDLKWADRVGTLPPEWNHLVGYDKPRTDAKVVHFTQGIPCWPETQDCEYAAEWKAEAKECVSTVSWSDLMGNSVHAEAVLTRFKKTA